MAGKAHGHPFLLAAEVIQTPNKSHRSLWGVRKDLGDDKEQFEFQGSFTETRDFT